MIDSKKKEIRVSSTLGKRVKKSENNEFGYERYELENIDLAKPSLLTFGGNATISDSLANGYAKTLQKILGVKSDDNFANFYTIHYGGLVGGNTGNVTIQEIEKIAQNFIKLVIDENGNKISKLQAQKNMRNINIVSHCFGASVVNEVFKYVFRTMVKKIGYSEEEAKDVLSQVFHLSYAPNINDLYFTTNILIKPLQDKTKYPTLEEYEQVYDVPQRQLGKNHKYSELIGGELDTNIYIGLAKFYEEDNNLFVFTNHMLDTEWEKDTHGINGIMKEDDWKVANYNRADVLSTAVSLVCAYALVNSIKNNKDNEKFEKLEDIVFLKSIMEQSIKRDLQGVKEEKYKKALEEKKKSDYSGLTHILDIFKKYGVTEKELINGEKAMPEFSFDEEEEMYDGLVNYSGTDFSEHYLKEPPKSLKGHDYIILANGERYNTSEKGVNLTNSIALKMRQKDLNGSIQCVKKYNILEDREYYKVVPNYGSLDGDKKFDTLQEMRNFWKDTYKENAFNKKVILTNEQIKSLTEILKSKNLGSEDVFYDEGIDLEKTISQNRYKEREM